MVSVIDLINLLPDTISAFKPFMSEKFVSDLLVLINTEDVFLMTSSLFMAVKQIVNDVESPNFEL